MFVRYKLTITEAKKVKCKDALIHTNKVYILTKESFAVIDNFNSFCFNRAVLQRFPSLMKAVTADVLIFLRVFDPRQSIVNRSPSPFTHCQIDE